MAHFGIPATVRASLAFYNNQGDIDALVAALARVKEIFG
jgi:cysteine desulfurase/selenocysteine lyase